MESFYMRLELDRVCDSLQQIVKKCEGLGSGVSRAGTMLSMEPDEMNNEVCSLFDGFAKSESELRSLCSKLGDLLFAADYQWALDEKMQSYLEDMRCISDMACAFGKAYGEYTASGSSGNPANTAELIRWQKEFSCRYPMIVKTCLEMIAFLRNFEQEYGYTEESIPIACVYAPPELMGILSQNDEASAISGVPLLNDENEETVRFCPKCGAVSKMSAEKCQRCGASFRYPNCFSITEDSTEMGTLYASPDLTGISIDQQTDNCQLDTAAESSSKEGLLRKRLRFFGK